MTYTELYLLTTLEGMAFIGFIGNILICSMSKAQLKQPEKKWDSV